MADYEEVTGSVEVPKNTGVEGFLTAIKGILKLPRVQGLTIDARGKITYRHFAREGEGPALAIDFESVLPHTIVRNGEVQEVLLTDATAPVGLVHLFAQMTQDHLFPTAFVGGAKSWFWDWFAHSTGLANSNKDELCGVPFLHDRFIEDHVLLLCAGYSRGSALIDTRKSYKLVIPKTPQVRP